MTRTPASDRPALILGAGSDIGIALAHLFAAEGRPVQLAARKPETLEEHRADIALRHGVEATTHAFDARDLAGMGAFYDGLPEMPNIVVSLVGFMPEQERTERDPALARLVVASNFTGPAIALDEAARRLAKLDAPAAVVGVSSVAGDRGRARNWWYGASKAGFTAALSGMRQAYARTQVNVITVTPGFVATRMTEGMDLPPALTLSPEAQARQIQRGIARGAHVVKDWRWRIVMGIISLIPEPIFKKMKF